MPIVLSLILLSSDTVQCGKTDALCWAQLYEAESERVELLQSGYEAAKRLAVLNDDRAELWKKTAIENAPKPPGLLSSPVLWLAVGFVVGATTAVAITFAVNQPGL